MLLWIFWGIVNFYFSVRRKHLITLEVMIVSLKQVAAQELNELSKHTYNSQYTRQLSTFTLYTLTVYTLTVYTYFTSRNFM